MKKIVDISGDQGRHPCFSAHAHKYARMHLPVAPACNITCNYCNRKYDCVNESRPGVTSEVLTPEGALKKYCAAAEKLDNLMVVGIAGPGDALANFEQTKRTVQLIREKAPDIHFCLSTNGLLLPKYALEIIALGIEYVTVTVNAVDPEIGSEIYGSVRYDGKEYCGEQGAEILIKNQLEGIRMLARNGVVVKVNIVTVKGVNESHVEDIVRTVRAAGAYITNIMPLIPTEGTKFENALRMEREEMHALRMRCEKHLKQMHHCRQCRADAVGTLAEDRSVEFRNIGCKAEPASGTGPKEMIV